MKKIDSANKERLGNKLQEILEDDEKLEIKLFHERKTLSGNLDEQIFDTPTLDFAELASSLVDYKKSWNNVGERILPMIDALITVEFLEMKKEKLSFRDTESCRYTNSDPETSGQQMLLMNAQIDETLHTLMNI